MTKPHEVLGSPSSSAIHIFTGHSGITHRMNKTCYNFSRWIPASNVVFSAAVILGYEPFSIFFNELLLQPGFLQFASVCLLCVSFRISLPVKTQT